MNLGGIFSFTRWRSVNQYCSCTLHVCITLWGFSGMYSYDHVSTESTVLLKSLWHFVFHQALCLMSFSICGWMVRDTAVQDGTLGEIFFRLWEGSGGSNCCSELVKQNDEARVWCVMCGAPYLLSRGRDHLLHIRDIVIVMLFNCLQRVAHRACRNVTLNSDAAVLLIKSVLIAERRLAVWNHTAAQHYNTVTLFSVNKQRRHCGVIAQSHQ